MAAQDPTERREPTPAELAAAAALSVFLKARRADPEVSPTEFTPTDEAAAKEFREAISGLYALGRRDEALDSQGNFAADSPALTPPAGETGSAPAASGCRFGRYTVLRTLGFGGMGVVYLAQQDSPHRTVALKVIRPGCATREMLRRFELEAQIMGQLRHPGIAQIYEAGTADTGFGPQPYFAMEYVRGMALTKYATREGLGTRALLELLTTVCDALQHAHQNGVIHRDLKPDNILVGEDGQPKILDFGVARATDGDIQPTALWTDVGELMGTVPYMSPEQAAGASRELDTRSDVYSLGVVMYELLAGRRPYEARDWRSPDALRVIREEAPTPLSSANRAFPGDLETIVSKALEKDKTRRYQSASDLAADIRHYLADEPIVARPPSAAYQLRKFARRNRLLVGSVLAVFVVLVAGITTTSAALVWALAAKQAASEAYERRDAVQRWNLWELTRPEPSSEPMSPAALQAVEEALIEKSPQKQAAARLALGRRHAAAKDYDRAEQELRKALGLYRSLHPDEHAAVLFTLESLAETLNFAHRYDAAIDLLNGVLAEHQGTGTADRLVKTRVYRALGDAVECVGRHEEAANHQREALRIGRDLLGDEHLAVVRSSLALCEKLVRYGPVDEAKHLAEKSVATRRDLLGDAEVGVLNARACLAGYMWLTGDYAEAEAEFNEIVLMDTILLPAGHPQLLVHINCLGCVLRDAGRYDEAEPLFRQVSEARAPWQRANPQVNLAKLLYYRGQTVDAERLFEEARKWREENLPPGDEGLAEPLFWLGLIRVDQGRLDEAESWLTQALKIRRGTLPDQHWLVGEAQSALGLLRTARGDYEAAEPLLLDAYQTVRAHLTDRSRMTKQCIERIVALYDAWHRPAQLAEWQAKLNAAHPATSAPDAQSP